MFLINPLKENKETVPFLKYIIGAHLDIEIKAKGIKIVEVEIKIAEKDIEFIEEDTKVVNGIMKAIHEWKQLADATKFESKVFTKEESIKIKSNLLQRNFNFGFNWLFKSLLYHHK